VFLLFRLGVNKFDSKLQFVLSSSVPRSDRYNGIFCTNVANLHLKPHAENLINLKI